MGDSALPTSKSYLIYYIENLVCDMINSPIHDLEENNY